MAKKKLDSYSRYEVPNTKMMINQIVEKIQNNMIRAWEGDNRNAVDAVTLEDFDPNDEDYPGEDLVVEYNGWYENLLTLQRWLNEEKK